jgi:hypothetical protein
MEGRKRKYRKSEVVEERIQQALKVKRFKQVA